MLDGNEIIVTDMFNSTPKKIRNFIFVGASDEKLALLEHLNLPAKNAEIIVEVVLGPISGSYTANITGSPKVSDHTRSYEDTRPWEFPDGHWETVNHIPPDIAIDKGWEALG